MSASGQAPRSPKDQDPVRIVYHVGNRTFARLFNERSLEEIKDVVRRKLGIGAETDVSLKQMGSDALLDLDDDGDFQAFRVHLKSSVSANIQVTVGASHGPVVPPPVEPQPRGGPSPSEPITTTSDASLSRENASATVSYRPNLQSEVAGTAEVSTISTETPLARKRKVSFDRDIEAASDKPAEQLSDRQSAHPAAEASVARKPSAQKRTQRKPIPVPPAASAKTVKSPATSKLDVVEESPKKKQKKEHAKKKEARTTEIAESPVLKPSAPSLKSKRSTTLDRGSKVDASAPNDSKTSEPLVKKQSKQKLVETTGKKKSSASSNKDGMDQPITQPSNSVGETALEAGSNGVDAALESRKSYRTVPPKGLVCASMPQTSESESVRSEVTAAILSGLSKASETVPPAPPAKRRPIRRVTIKPSASSSAFPTEPASVLDVPANEARDLPAKQRPEEVAPINKSPQQTSDLNGPSCPICLGEPFHIRYCCPIVLKGSDAIRERLEELKRANVGDPQSLIKQLESLLRDSEGSLLGTAQADDVQSKRVSSQPNASLPRTPNIPSNSHLTEVAVEDRDEGSSSESSDDTSESGSEHHELSAPSRQKTSDEQPLILPPKNGLEAAVGGPTSTRKSVLGLIYRIVADENDSDSDSEEDEARLEEDTDKETGRSKCRYSKCFTRSSDSESEEEESSSPSPSRSDEGAPDNLAPGIQGSSKFEMKSAEDQEGDVVMADSVNPPVVEGQHDDSNDETHVGSEDGMVVDEPTRENGVAMVAKEQPSPPVPKASALQHSSPPSDEPQESARRQVEDTPNGDTRVPALSEVPEGVEADSIEPADDVAPSAVSSSANTNPIELPLEDLGSLFASTPQLIPKSGVSKRIKTHNDQILDDEADHPILLEEVATEATDEMTPISVKGKLRRKATEISTSQEPMLKRRSPRFSSVPSSTSTPAPLALLNHRIKSRKATRTPAKQSEERSEVSKSNGKDDPIPQSFVRWETLTEPLSPSVQLEEPSIRVDELVSSSPELKDVPLRRRSNEQAKKGRPRKSAGSSQAESSLGKERLFDLTPSQIPFPYSQTRINLARTLSPNGKECEGTTDSEEEPEVAKKRTNIPVRYRPLSQLASQAFFSPSLPASRPKKSLSNGKTRKRAAEEDSSSSSSSDENEANGSEHIPQGRRAGSVLETKKRKSLLSKI